MKVWPVFAALVVAGFALSFATSAFSGERESWDSQQFWILTMPMMIGAAAVAGFITRRNAVLWGVAVTLGLLLHMAVASGEVGSMWAAGLVLGVVMAALCSVGAALGARLRGSVTTFR